MKMKKYILNAHNVRKWKIESCLKKAYALSVQKEASEKWKNFTRSLTDAEKRIFRGCRFIKGESGGRR